MKINFFYKNIDKIKRITLPGEVSQLKMAPPYRQQLLKLSEEKRKQARQAAVMALLYPNEENDTRIMLILRKTYKGVHSAQVGFPGGKVEPEDKNLEETARRETHEEVGVAPELIKVVRPLTSVYIPPSNFYVHPFLGYCDKAPNFVKQDSEVEALLDVSIHTILNPENKVTKTVSTSYEIDVETPAFKLNGHLVWGATAMMLNELKDLLNSVKE